MELTICIDWHGRGLEVTGCELPGCPGGDYEPPCPDGFEILRVEDEDGDDVRLTGEERRELESICLKRIQEGADGDYADVLIERELDRRAA